MTARNLGKWGGGGLRPRDQRDLGVATAAAEGQTGGGGGGAQYSAEDEAGSSFFRFGLVGVSLPEAVLVGVLEESVRASPGIAAARHDATGGRGDPLSFYKGGQGDPL